MSESILFQLVGHVKKVELHGKIHGNETALINNF